MAFGKDTEVELARLRSLPETVHIHVCDACTCGACACGQRGLYQPYDAYFCERCGRHQEVMNERRADVERWQKQLDAGGVYVVNEKSRLLHRWDCHSMNSLESGLEHLRRAEEDPDSGWLQYWPRLPQLKTVAEVRAMPRRYRGCQLCKPDPV